MVLTEYLAKAVQLGSSDVFIVPGAPVTAKVGGRLIPLDDIRLKPQTTQELIESCYEVAHRDSRLLNAQGDDDFSFALKDLSRFRCNIYRQRGTLAATCRIVAFGLPDPNAFGIPKEVIELSALRSGMVLVTGPAGSGKSTTLACIIDAINTRRDGHIITIEDPIEFLHPHKKSLVSQREVPSDAPNFAHALRGALRQAPNVIMLGEMRDSETMQVAITAAETGHLLLSSLHTIGAAKSIDRIIDTFPASQQQQIRVQLSMVLRAVVSQRLIPGTNGRQIPLFEVMTVTPAVQNLIRDGRTHQIENAVHGSGNDRLSIDSELFRLYRAKQIDRDTAIAFASNPEMLEKRLI